MKDNQKIFKEKAISGYSVCFAEQCPKKGQCLRWLVGQQIPDDKCFYYCVNPRSQGVGTEECPHFRKAEKVSFAKGMMHIYNENMPKRVEPYVRQRLIGSHCRTYYFEFRKGQRLIPPAIQEEIRQYFREAGWNEEVSFDSYIKDFEW